MKRVIIKLSFLSLLLVFISADKAAEKVHISEVSFLNGIYSHSDRPITGEIIDYYENEKLKFTYGALEGRLHGKAVEFYDNGDIRSERHYTYNKLFGEFTEYFKDGDVKLQFKVGLNAYGKGELLTEVKIAKPNNHKLKSYDEATLIFLGEKNESLCTSEEISILNQSKFKIVDKDGKLLFQHN
ncbi:MULTISPECIES: toxin-antitoxin system YwqK family antitoxin [Roseivirga]|uniref:MORN repeat protein n=1 Tax=Roseivirga spongicola TaxID=333140 RepID=A0A150X410_9BACT|nr:MULTISPECIES: hypothetical protein [Roseivirga]KYG73458.1 hypothetical protein AWW68_12245 [Roseivirga spongicola]MBO6496021.1 hypothetical protein [Roseivirga sp.]MBO6659719.1 hypothetical protein [Roseivirga sp.]MBO6907544.1 hypothetical protein [Roseivirga sp.]WPZ09918.1 hypothetical protein T7867_16755 [Roseivirga spongicola]